MPRGAEPVSVQEGARPVEGARVVVLWNGAAGPARDGEELVAELGERPGVVVRRPDGRTEAERLARDASDAGAELVVAAGGDGTVNAVAAGLARARGGAALGVLPLGTANDLARSLGVPLDPVEAVALWERPRVRPLDLVEVDAPGGPRAVVNVATAGNSAAIAAATTSEAKERWGALCYLRGALSLGQLETYALALRFDGGAPERFEAINLLVCNGRHSGGGLEVAPRASLEDGELDVVVVLDGSPVDVAALAARLALADWLESEHVVWRRARTLEVRSEPPAPYTLDGDPAPAGPARFVARKGALRVVVGEGYVG